MIELAIMCLTLNAYHEARGESNAGVKAVTDVVITRALKQNTDVCTEVFRPYQFSWANGSAKHKGNVKQQYKALSNQLEKRKDKTELNRFKTLTYKMTDVVLKLESNKDPRTTNYTHYHAVSVNPKWNNGYRPKKIGSHLFYKIPL